MDKTQVNLGKIKTYDKALSFEEAKHKRDANGRFTSGENKAEQSPLRKAAKVISKPAPKEEGNGLSINITSNMMATVENELQRFKEDPEYRRKTKSTLQGLQWAKEFLTTRGENLSEKELSHAIRLTQFRGPNKPKYVGD